MDDKSGEAAKKVQEEETQNKAKACLMVGQSQQVMTIVRYLHHFAATSVELKGTRTGDAARVLLSMVTPKYNGIELGTLQLGVQDVSLTWNAIWSMERQQRVKMCGKLVEKMDEFRFPKGGPDFKVVTEWGVSGDFAVVKHTRKGTTLLHHDFENGDIKGFFGRRHYTID